MRVNRRAKKRLVGVSCKGLVVRDVRALGKVSVVMGDIGSWMRWNWGETGGEQSRDRA